MVDSKQIRVTTELKRKLDRLKIHHRETYADIIERLLENGHNPN